MVEKDGDLIIETNNCQECAFCGSRNIGGGSWSPDGCRDCGAVYYFDAWIKEKEQDNGQHI